MIRAARARLLHRATVYGLVLGLAGASTLVGFAAPAVAGGVVVATCPPGSWTGATGLCYNSATQNVLRTANGDPIGTSSKALDNAPKVKNLSSAIKATGATTGENVAAAEATAAANGGRLATAGRLASTVGGRVIPALGAFATGYQIGTWLAQGSCAVGVDALCMPRNTPAADPSYSPNLDTAGLAGDPGWIVKGGQATVRTGTTTNVAFDTTGGPSTKCVYSSILTSCSGSDLNPALVFTAFGAPDLGAGVSSGAAVFTLQVVCRTSAGVYAAGTGGNSPFSLRANWSSSSRSWTGSNDGKPSTNFAAVVGAYANGWIDTGNVLRCASGQGTIAGLTVALSNLSNQTSFLAPDGTWKSTASGGPTYRLSGDPARPPAVSPDPSRTIVVTNTCLNPDGTTTTKSATGASFTEGGTGTIPFPKTVEPCPAGSVVSHSDVKETSPGLADKTIGSVDVPKGITDQATNYPACTNGACQLTLFKTSGAALLDCSGTVGLCTGWFTDPNKSSTYTCKYGPAGAASDATVDLSECNVYAPSYDPEKTAQCQYYGSPVDGSTAGGNQCNVPGSTSIGDSGGGTPCFPGGWGQFNPLNWVLQPVKCALVWAFVPSTTAWQQTASDLGNKLKGTGFQPWVDAISGLVTGFAGAGGSGGCMGPAFAFPITKQTFYPLAACDPPMSVVATVSRTVITVGVVLFGALAGVRAIGSGLGFEVSIGSRVSSDS